MISSSTPKVKQKGTEICPLFSNPKTGEKMSDRDIVWVCQACGKTQEDPYDFKDPACFMNSIACYRDKLKFDGSLVKEVKEGGIVEPQPEPQTKSSHVSGK